MEKDNNAKIEAQRLREFRLAEGLTQKEIADILKRDTSHINKFESGERRIQIKDIRKLHMKLGLSYEWFYHGRGEKKYKVDRKLTIKDVKALQTDLSIALNKIEQLDAGLKKIYRDFYQAKS